MSLALNMQSACKIMVASGIAKSDTHDILATLEREQNGSGSEFILQRLKALREFCVNRYIGKPTTLSWFRVSQSGLPKDRGWRKLITSDPVKGIQNTSVLIMDMVRTPDQKTKDAIYDNILRHDPISQEIRKDFVIPNERLVRAFNEGPLYSSDRRYAPDTLQGVSFPLYEGKTYRVRTTKSGEKDKDSVLTLYYEGLCSAPYLLADHLLEKADVLRHCNRRGTFDEEIDYLETIQDIIRVEAFDNMSDLSDYGGDLSKVEIPQIVGSIGVIPSPGFKDRVIANPNPAVQSALYDFGEYLGQITARLEGCYVFNQQAGIAKIQDYLSKGIELASVDLTAATDRLSADAGWELISNCIQHAPLKSMLELDLDFFKKVSRSAFYIGNLGDDGVEYVSYTQGQPMGLKPSFPMLTLMNLKAGMDAQESVPGSVAPVVVGDDIVIDARCLPRYQEIIQGLGGVINPDKTIVSKTHSKFCSRIISQHSVIREKPRYVYGDRMQNALQLGNLNILKPWERRVALSAASQSIDDLDHININVDKRPLVDRITDRAIQRLADKGLDFTPYTMRHEIAKLSLSVRENEETQVHRDIVAARKERFQYETGLDLSEVYDSLEFIDHLGEMEIPVVVTKFDHHKGERAKSRGDVQRIKKIAKSSKSNVVSQATIDHHCGDLLYDRKTLLFEPHGSEQVIDLTPSLREEQEKVAAEIAKTPVSNKRHRLPSEFESILHAYEEQWSGKDDDEYSLEL